ncbi:MAG: Ku protein [Candidatus Obscuribacterales bacterium]|nr:Ku protein [Candidatus Obscuribacterales bacterium]
MWTGIIGFGMVSIPVRLYAATENKSIAFHQIHNKCKNRIKEVRWCPSCDREISWDEIEKGYEYAKGQYVAISAEDMENLPLPSKEVISVSSFASESEIDPIYFEKSYLLEVDQAGARPFALFLQALQEKGMTGVATVALRTKERLCLLRPLGDLLILSTLYYPDEIRIDVHNKKQEKKLSHTKLSKQELDMARSLIDMMTKPFDPTEYTDHYREALAQVIEGKTEGLPTAERPKSSGKVVDLMDALKASIVQAKGKPKTARKTTKAKKPATRRSAAKTKKATSRKRGAA